MTAAIIPDPAPLPMVSVCICVVGKLQRLDHLLASLAVQTYPLKRIQIVVVDGGDGSMAAMADAARPGLQQPIQYVNKTAATISQARNIAASLATGDWIAYIDTEYEPTAGWLEEMVRTAIETLAAVVLGPKIALFPAGTATWVTRSGFFEKRRFETGARVSSDFGRTSNSLIAATWLKGRSTPPFEMSCGRYDLDGHDFFLWVEKSEGRIVWCDKAVVSTVVPRTRHNLGYMLTRSLNSSSAYWRNVNRHRSKLQAWVEALNGVAGAAGAAVVGTVMLPRGLHAAAPYWVKMAKGLGRAVALTGKSRATTQFEKSSTCES